MKDRVLIVDDHDLLRKGVAEFLAAQWKVVGQAANGKDAIALAKTTSPDIVVLDLSMPQLGGIETMQMLLAHDPSLKIVFFTQQLGREQIRAAFHAGARGYVAKQAAAIELAMALQAARAGAYYITPTADLPEFRGKSGKAMLANPIHLIASPLTPRQVEVLHHIAEGRSAKEIAFELGISTKTVEFHRNCIGDVLGVRTTAELTRYAIANGILPI